jgi:hypothetical protein
VLTPCVWKVLDNSGVSYPILHQGALWKSLCAEQLQINVAENSQDLGSRDNRTEPVARLIRTLVHSNSYRVRPCEVLYNDISLETKLRIPSVHVH